MTALDIVYSLPFLLGAIAGLVVDRIIKCAQARALDKAAPLPDGKKHRPDGYSRTYVAALAAAATLGYVVLTMIHTEHRYETLAQELIDCQAINVENDSLSQRQRDLFLERVEAEDQWLDRLLAPPPELAGVPNEDGRLQAWRVDVTRVYHEKTAGIDSQIRDVQARQRQVDADRRARPTCTGQGEEDR